MREDLKHINLNAFKLRNGHVQNVSVSYQLYGCTLHTAPIILVNHALTGNSSVMIWWQQQVGAGKAIDTNKFTVLCMDIPGNGYDGIIEHLIYNYRDWTLGDVATVFIETLKQLRVCYIHAGIGGSIGGALLWEMVVQEPELFNRIMPVAADWKATDWVVACCHVQQAFLENSSQPVVDARKHAMTFYRSPESLKQKFNREKANQFKVQNWLDHHGNALKDRFTLPAYKLLNHLLTTTDAALAHNGNLLQALAYCDTHICIVSIDSDGFFVPQEDLETYELLAQLKSSSHEHILSIHGHDAFLMEHDQVAAIITYQLQTFKKAHVAKPYY